MNEMSFLNISQFAESVLQDLSIIEKMINQGYIEPSEVAEDGSALFSVEQVVDFPEIYEYTKAVIQVTNQTAIQVLAKRQIQKPVDKKSLSTGNLLFFFWHL